MRVDQWIAQTEAKAQIAAWLRQRFSCARVLPEADIEPHQITRIVSQERVEQEFGQLCPGVRLRFEQDPRHFLTDDLDFEGLWVTVAPEDAPVVIDAFRQIPMVSFADMREVLWAIGYEQVNPGRWRQREGRNTVFLPEHNYSPDEAEALLRAALMPQRDIVYFLRKRIGI